MNVRAVHEFSSSPFLVSQFKHWHKMKKTNCSYVQSRQVSTMLEQISFKPDDFKNDDKESTVYDLVVIGGGIVGVTAARAMLMEKPNFKIAVIEKEPDIAQHQSSHNSGVIHAGIYYKPNSLKAKLCVAGLQKTYEFCDTHDVPYRKCGKLIVATNEIEEFNLKQIYRTALVNKAPDIELVGPEKMKEIEPHCQCEERLKAFTNLLTIEDHAIVGVPNDQLTTTYIYEGLRAIYSPHTGTIDWGLFTKYCAKDIQQRGGHIFCNFKVDKIREANEGTDSADVASNPVELHDSEQGLVVRTKYGIACGGLHSDKLARIADGLQQPIIIPFRGEYLELTEKKRNLLRGNIYPVPDPRFPFLGVHFTPRLDGRVLLGPNAVLAFSREGYSWKDVNTKELLDILSFSGFRKLIFKYGSYGIKESLKSFFISLQVKELQRYIPEITTNDVEYRGFSGVRAQAMDEHGALIDDLVMQFGTEGINTRILHVRNAPSPAATSSLALSEFITKEALVKFDY